MVAMASVTTGILSQWRPLLSSRKFDSSSIAPPVPSPTVRQTASKEYIYAGGKMIATDGPLPPTAVGDAASYTSQQVTNPMITGHTYNVSITMSNNGPNTWTPANPAYSLVSRGDSVWDVSSVAVPTAVFFNNSVTFTFAITAPSTPGTYNFQWQMADDGILFGSPSETVAMVVSPTLTAPASLLATASSLAQVNLNWGASTGTTVGHYVVERTNNIAAGYTVVSSSVNGTSYTDTGVSSGKAYLYRIRAVDTAGNYSYYSNLDLATTITFTNDPIADPQVAVTRVQAQHLIELRTAINAVRALTGTLPPANWDVQHPLQTGARVWSGHILELRSNLNQARAALGLPALSYTDPNLSSGYRIQRAHIQELRNGVK